MRKYSLNTVSCKNINNYITFFHRTLKNTKASFDDIIIIHIIIMYILIVIIIIDVVIMHITFIFIIIICIVTIYIITICNVFIYIIIQLSINEVIKLRLQTIKPTNRV